MICRHACDRSHVGGHHENVVGRLTAPTRLSTVQKWCNKRVGKPGARGTEITLALRSIYASVSCSATQGDAVIDQDFIDELNKVKEYRLEQSALSCSQALRVKGPNNTVNLQISNRTLEVLSSGQEGEAQALTEELQSMREILEEEHDQDSSRFLRVLQGLLNHKLLKEAEQLEGMYSAATDRIFNQVGLYDDFPGDDFLAVLRLCLKCSQTSSSACFKGTL